MFDNEKKAHVKGMGGKIARIFSTATLRHEYASKEDEGKNLFCLLIISN